MHIVPYPGGEFHRTAMDGATLRQRREDESRDGSLLDAGLYCVLWENHNSNMYVLCAVG